MTEYFFAPCPRGLENTLSSELLKLGAENPKEVPGGVSFSGPLGLIYTMNLGSRLASRILWRLEKRPYRNEQDVYEISHNIHWPRFFEARRSLRVDLNATHSPLQSLSFATLRIKDAICDRFRAEGFERPNVEKHHPDVRVSAYLTKSECSLYLDTSGEALFKRGYRTHTEEAPLRENLAVGLLALSEWNPDMPLLDPMCGSGTIAIEAAMIAAEQPPGLHRDFGFQKLKCFDGPTWQRLRQKARDAVRPPPGKISLFASDCSENAIKHAQLYAQYAHVAPWIAFSCLDVCERQPPAPRGIWITNPPYGVRLGDQDTLATLYPTLGTRLKKHFMGWDAWFLSGDTQLPSLVGLKPARRVPLFNGALDCRFYKFKIIEGSMRRIKKTPEGESPTHTQ